MLLKFFRLGLASVNRLQLVILAIWTVIFGLMIGSSPVVWPFSYIVSLGFLIFIDALFPSAAARRAQQDRG